ncbi:MAG: DNA-processing protein DprA [Actinomycetota bacterium]|nr:DNA-processing protein DprA [Actinomycetota bacterium]
MAAGVDDAEREARMMMSRLAEPGDADACHLVHEHSALALIERLRTHRGRSSKLADWSERLGSASLRAICDGASSVGARYVCPGDPEWPVRLDDLALVDESSADRRGGEPFGLWVRGSGHLADICDRSVAIVGARAATAYGEHVAGDLAAECGERGYTVVSGGAYGIDAAAHRGALAVGRPSVAALAGGIDKPYPSGNIRLLERLTMTGVIVAEAAPGCTPTRSRFLVRNRLIAALSLGVVVVEAALRSGSLNTARWARDLNRSVLGVPGPVTSPASAGVHELLRQPETVLVTDAAEVVEQLSPVGAAPAAVKSGQISVRDLLDARSQRVLDAVPVYNAASARSIAATAGLRLADVEQRLDQLGESGLATTDGRGWRLTLTD